MSPDRPSHPAALGWLTWRSLRWHSGLVLWLYTALHLVNHATGLVSLEAAQSVRQGMHALWGSLPGGVLLYGAAGLHIGAALQALWRRRSLRMDAADALRTGLGLLLPVLLASHVAATRGSPGLWSTPVDYTMVVGALRKPASLGWQLAMLATVWPHGCIGLHLAWRNRTLYRRLRPALSMAAVLLPLLAALGTWSMVRELAWSAAAQAGARTFAPPLLRSIRQLELGVWQAWAGLLGSLALAWLLRRLWQGRARAATVTLRYPDRTVTVPRGWSVLEASRAHGIAHASLCGGRARCSTCRVRVQGVAGSLPPPRADEQRTLARVNAPADVRLACQLRPRGDVAVQPLLRHADRPGARHGEERPVAVLFVDLRRWSALAERQWPFDLVYLLDQYFARVGVAVRDCGGVANQFIGDSVMALFGLDCGLEEACRQALRAAARIEQELDAWNAELQPAFGQPIDFGMGLHAGRAAVGEVGYRDRVTLSAVGEVVNTASRLQDHTKAAAVRLVVSLDAARLAGIAPRPAAVQRITVRGRSGPLEVVAIPGPAQWVAAHGLDHGAAPSAAA